jgi:hypothetical protein
VGDHEGVKVGRQLMALLDAEEGCFEDALDGLLRLAEEHPYHPALRLTAAEICGLLGWLDEGEGGVRGGMGGRGEGVRGAAGGGGGRAVDGVGCGGC